jgi:hypothetical protein
MHATLHLQRGPLLALLALFFLALMAALAPGLSELELGGFYDGGTGDPGASLSRAPDVGGTPVWVSDPLAPSLAGMERLAGGR